MKEDIEIKSLKSISELIKKNYTFGKSAMRDLARDIDKILYKIEQLEEENKKLKKYDIRNIKIGDDKILKSPSFTKEEIDLMNLGIALSTSFDVLFNDEREE